MGLKAEGKVGGRRGIESSGPGEAGKATKLLVTTVCKSTCCGYCVSKYQIFPPPPVLKVTGSVTAKTIGGAK